MRGEDEDAILRGEGWPAGQRRRDQGLSDGASAASKTTQCKESDTQDIGLEWQAALIQLVPAFGRARMDPFHCLPFVARRGMCQHHSDGRLYRGGNIFGGLRLAR